MSQTRPWVLPLLLAGLSVVMEMGAAVASRQGASLGEVAALGTIAVSLMAIAAYRAVRLNRE
jgi:hypothetical protein